jgi:hypothetical protein
MTRYTDYPTYLKFILPNIQDKDKMIMMNIITALRLEGTIGDIVSEKDSVLIKHVYESIMSNAEKKESVLGIIENYQNLSIRKENTA